MCEIICTRSSKKKGLLLFLLRPNLLNSMNIKSGTTSGHDLCECLPLEVPLFDAVKGRPLSSGDGLPGLLMGCQIWGNMLSELPCLGSVNEGHL